VGLSTFAVIKTNQKEVIGVKKQPPLDSACVTEMAGYPQISSKFMQL